MVSTCMHVAGSAALGHWEDAMRRRNPQKAGTDWKLGMHSGRQSGMQLGMQSGRQVEWPSRYALEIRDAIRAASGVAITLRTEK